MTLQYRLIWVCLFCLAWAGLCVPAFAQNFQNQSSHGNAGLFVGIETFGDDTGIKSLDFSVESAIEMAHLFVIEMRLIPAENCYLCLSNLPSADSKHAQMLSRLKAQVQNESQGRNQLSIRGATKADIVTNLKQAAVKGESHGQNVLVCYFTTHGFEEANVPYLVPSDGNSDPFFRANAALDFNLVQQFIAKQSKAGHKLVFCDACREVKQYGEKSLDHRILGRPLDRKAFEAFSKPTPGIYKVLSCDRDQKSYEDPELHHGVFTYYLMKAIREEHPDQDQEGVLEVTLGTVVNRAKADVEAWSKRISQQENKDYKQSPQVFVEDDVARAKFEKLPLSRYVAVWSSLNWIDTITNHPSFKTNKPEVWNEAKSVLNDFQQSNAYHKRVADVVAEGITVNNLRYFEFQMDQAMKAKPIYESQVSKLISMKEDKTASLTEPHKSPPLAVAPDTRVPSRELAGFTILLNTEYKLKLNQEERVIFNIENLDKSDVTEVTVEVYLPKGLTHPMGNHLELPIGTFQGSTTRTIAINLTGVQSGIQKLSMRIRAQGARGPIVEIPISVAESMVSSKAEEASKWLQNFAEEENSGILDFNRHLYTETIDLLKTYDETCPIQTLILEQANALKSQITSSTDVDGKAKSRLKFESRMSKYLILSQMKSTLKSNFAKFDHDSCSAAILLLNDHPGIYDSSSWGGYTSDLHAALGKCAEATKLTTLQLQLATQRHEMLNRSRYFMKPKEWSTMLRTLRYHVLLLRPSPEQRNLLAEIELSTIRHKFSSLSQEELQGNPLPLADEFRDWFSKYPNVASSPEIAFQLAMQETAERGMEQAIPHFQIVVDRYSSSSYAQTAARWIQEHRGLHPRPQATQASSPEIQPKEISPSSIEDDFLNGLGL